MVIYRHADKYAVSEMCRFFHVSRSGYYGYISRMDIPAWDFPLAKKYGDVRSNAARPTDIAEYIYVRKGTVYIVTIKQY